MAVQLELSRDNRVHTPAVHVQRGLRQHEGASIRHRGAFQSMVLTRLERSNQSRVYTGSVQGHLRATKVGLVVGILRAVPVSSIVGWEIVIDSSGICEKAAGINIGTRIGSNRLRTTESMDSVGKSINSIGVVEGLGTKNLEQEGIASQGRAIVNVLIRLDDPDKLLHRVVEVELDLVTGRTDRLITCELELSDQVLVGVLGHSAALIRVQEHVVNVQRGSNQRLVVGNCGRDRASNSVLAFSTFVGLRVAVQGGNSPQALINRADVKVDLDLMILESDQRQRKTRVCAKPELERHIQSCLRKSVTGSAHLTGSQGRARGFHISERGVRDECELSGVSNHLEIAALLLCGHGKLVPDVHPITILAIDSLATNLDLHLGDKLLAGEIQPTSIDTGVLSGGVVSKTHKLVDLGKSNL